MDGGHPSDDPVPNRHVVEMNWYRIELTGAYSFAPLWDIEVNIPFDIKDQKADYHLPDGTPFDNPAGDIHHRTETLTGFSDITALVNYRPPVGLLPNDFAQIGFGLTLPVGETEADPFALGDQGLRHQHIQFGDGTFNPVLRLGYTSTPDWWGFGITAGMRTPFYENSKGYEGPFTADYSLGVRANVNDWLGMGLRYTGLYQDRAHWNDVPDENSGYLLHAIMLTTPIEVTSELTIMPSVMYVLDVETLQGADNFVIDWMFSISLSYAFM